MLMPISLDYILLHASSKLSLSVTKFSKEKVGVSQNDRWRQVAEVSHSQLSQRLKVQLYT